MEFEFTNEDILEIIEEDALPIIEFLKKKENISEFKIAEELKIEIHVIRNILYRLNGEHLVTYIRKKDRIKGWYISYWTLNESRFKELLPKVKIGKIEKLKTRLENETNNQFYMCRNLCARLEFDKAIDLNFKCPECGKIMNFQDNTRTIEFLKEKIKKSMDEISA